MITNEYGQVSFDNQELLSMLYAGQNIDNCRPIDEHEQSLHQQHANLFEIAQLNLAPMPSVSAVDYHGAQSSNWKMPDEYKTLDIKKLLMQKLVTKGLDTPQYKQRVSEELEEYSNRNMTNALRFLHYLINTCTEHDIVTGIGRGSSVSSLVLHLLDVHHIDPLKYNLNYKEFLR